MPSKAISALGKIILRCIKVVVYPFYFLVHVALEFLTLWIDVKLEIGTLCMLHLKMLRLECAK